MRAVPSLRQLRFAVALRSEMRRRSRYDRASVDERAAWRALRLDELRRHAVGRSPGYQALHRGLTDAPLWALPVIGKSDLVERFDDMVTDRSLELSALRRRVEGDDGGRHHRYRIAVSSGSTGRPGLFPFHRREWVHLLVAAARSRMVVGTRASGGQLRSARIGSPSRWHMSTQLPTTLQDPRRPVLVLDAAQDVSELAARLSRYEPTILSGYPSAIAALAREQEDGRVTIHPEAVLTGGEPLTDPARRVITDAWEVRPTDQYLTTEVAFVAVECDRHDGLHVLDDHVVVETVDRDGAPLPAGERGRVVITALWNRTLPLIRYDLGDTAALVTDACRCGRTSPRLTGLGGGARSLLRLPSVGGEIEVHPVVFTSVLDRTAVRAWQVVQHRDRLEVLVVGGDTSDDDALASALAAALRGAGAAPLPVLVRHVDGLLRAPSGKAGLVIRAPD
jgi:phenylacetate-CoA ligase